MNLAPVPYALPADRPLCFVHVPKTAGTSLNYLMQYVYGPDDTCPTHFWADIAEMPTETLDTYKFIGAHMSYDIRERLTAEPVYITFLREPIDRLLSYYYFTQEHQRSVFYHDLPLDEFLEDPRFNWITRNSQTHFIGTNQPITFRGLSPDAPRPRIPYEPVTAQTLATAKERLSQSAFVGLQSRFDESLQALCHLLGWQSVEMPPRKNVTKKRKRRADVPDALIERIRDLNPYDFELYAHAQELFEQTLHRITQGGTVPLVQATDAHYREVFRQQFPPRAQYHYDMRYTLPGSGWRIAERNAQHGIFRWTGERAFVDVPIAADAPRQVAIKVIAAIQPEVLQGFRLQVNDEPVTMTRETGEQRSSVYRAEVAPEILAKQYPVRLTVSVEQTFSPKDVGMGPRDRQVGVAIAGIDIT